MPFCLFLFSVFQDSSHALCPWRLHSKTRLRNPLLAFSSQLLQIQHQIGPLQKAKGQLLPKPPIRNTMKSRSHAGWAADRAFMIEVLGCSAPACKMHQPPALRNIPRAQFSVGACTHITDGALAHQRRLASCPLSSAPANFEQVAESQSPWIGNTDRTSRTRLAVSAASPQLLGSSHGLLRD